MTALTKVDIAKKLNADLGLSVPEAKDLVEQFFEEIRVALEKGSHVHLSGFGNFDLRDKVARPGRNPKTGEAVTVSARRVVTFKTSQKLKSAVIKRVPNITMDQNG